MTVTKCSKKVMRLKWNKNLQDKLLSPSPWQYSTIWHFFRIDVLFACFAAPSETSKWNNCVWICILYNNLTEAYKMLQTAYVSRAPSWAQIFQWFKSSEEVRGCRWWPMQWMTENELQVEFVNKVHSVLTRQCQLTGSELMWTRNL